MVDESHSCQDTVAVVILLFLFFEKANHVPCQVNLKDGLEENSGLTFV